MLHNNYEISGIELRPEVKWFAEKMDLKLRQNDDLKGRTGWLKAELSDIANSLESEMKEFDLAVDRNQSIDAVLSEAADIGNFAMMAADLYARGQRYE